jgi:hypothetical protein
MTTHRPSESESLDSLINAAKEFVRQLERVKLAGTHHERAQGRPRQKATPKPSIDKTRFLAVLRAISKRVQAYIAKLEEQESYEETQEQEAHRQEMHEQERHAHEIQEHEIQEEIHEQENLAGYQQLSERNERALNLRFPCRPSQLGKNLVGTIQEALQKLVSQDVNDRGYLILEVQETWDALELTKLLRTAKAPGRDEIKGLNLFEEPPTPYTREWPKTSRSASRISKDSAKLVCLLSRRWSLRSG